MVQSDLSKENHVQEAIIETLLVQSLPLFEVNDLRKVQDCLYHVKIELAEDRVVVVQAQMTHINLNFFPGLIIWSPTCTLIMMTLNQRRLSLLMIEIVSSCRISTFTKLFPNFKETLLDFLFNPWFQLLFHVVKFKVLTFEVFERIRFLSIIAWLHVPHYRLCCRIYSLNPAIMNLIWQLLSRSTCILRRFQVLILHRIGAIG